MISGDLKGKKIIVTGASKGLGAICAHALGRVGAELVLVARSSDKLQAVAADCGAGRVLPLSADLTNSVELSNFFLKAQEFLGGIDVVVHVLGGGLGLHNPFLSMTEVMTLFQLNVAAAVEINRLVVPHMKAQGHGNLVHVGSIASAEATGSVGYNTVKGALAAYVRSLGNELAKDNIVATGILPGGFFAPENSWRRLEQNKPEIVAKFIRNRLPRGFLARAEEIIPLLMLLCSDQASMMGGCMVPIDAGEGKSYAQ